MWRLVGWEQVLELYSAIWQYQGENNWFVGVCMEMIIVNFLSLHANANCNKRRDSLFIFSFIKNKKYDKVEVLVIWWGVISLFINHSSTLCSQSSIIFLWCTLISFLISHLKFCCASIHFSCIFWVFDFEILGLNNTFKLYWNWWYYV